MYFDVHLENFLPFSLPILIVIIPLLCMVKKKLYVIQCLYGKIVYQLLRYFSCVALYGKDLAWRIGLNLSILELEQGIFPTQVTVSHVWFCPSVSMRQCSTDADIGHKHVRLLLKKCVLWTMPTSTDLSSNETLQNICRFLADAWILQQLYVQLCVSIARTSHEKRNKLSSRK